ncbi:hypothetical protein DIPPA_25077 [Diplonema papillatum]|nr:hypothetical protein DIPPA_25077 [Diplonema papillatum]
MKRRPAEKWVCELTVEHVLSLSGIGVPQPFVDPGTGSILKRPVSAMGSTVVREGILHRCYAAPNIATLSVNLFHFWAKNNPGACSSGIPNAPSKSLASEMKRRPAEKWVCELTVEHVLSLSGIGVPQPFVDPGTGSILKRPVSAMGSTVVREGILHRCYAAPNIATFLASEMKRRPAEKWVCELTVLEHVLSLSGIGVPQPFVDPGTGSILKRPVSAMGSTVVREGILHRCYAAPNIATFLASEMKRRPAEKWVCELTVLEHVLSLSGIGVPQPFVDPGTGSILKRPVSAMGSTVVREGIQHPAGSRSILRRDVVKQLHSWKAAMTGLLGPMFDVVVRAVLKDGADAAVHTAADVPEGLVRRLATRFGVEVPERQMHLVGVLTRTALLSTEQALSERSSRARHERRQLQSLVAFDERRLMAGHDHAPHPASFASSSIGFAAQSGCSSKQPAGGTGEAAKGTPWLAKLRSLTGCVEARARAPAQGPSSVVEYLDSDEESAVCPSVNPWRHAFCRSLRFHERRAGAAAASGPAHAGGETEATSRPHSPLIIRLLRHAGAARANLPPELPTVYLYDKQGPSPPVEIKLSTPFLSNPSFHTSSCYTVRPDAPGTQPPLNPISHLAYRHPTNEASLRFSASLRSPCTSTLTLPSRTPTCQPPVPRAWSPSSQRGNGVRALQRRLKRSLRAAAGTAPLYPVDDRACLSAVLPEESIMRGSPVLRAQVSRQNEQVHAGGRKDTLPLFPTHTTATAFEDADEPQGASSRLPTDTVFEHDGKPQANTLPLFPTHTTAAAFEDADELQGASSRLPTDTTFEHDGKLQASTSSSFSMGAFTPGLQAGAAGCDHAGEPQEFRWPVLTRAAAAAVEAGVDPRPAVVVGEALPDSPRNAGGPQEFRWLVGTGAAAAVAAGSDPRPAVVAGQALAPDSPCDDAGGPQEFRWPVQTGAASAAVETGSDPRPAVVAGQALAPDSPCWPVQTGAAAVEAGSDPRPAVVAGQALAPDSPCWPVQTGAAAVEAGSDPRPAVVAGQALAPDSPSFTVGIGHQTQSGTTQPVNQDEGCVGYSRTELPTLPSPPCAPDLLGGEIPDDAGGRAGTPPPQAVEEPPLSSYQLHLLRLQRLQRENGPSRPHSGSERSPPQSPAAVQHGLPRFAHRLAHGETPPPALCQNPPADCPPPAQTRGEAVIDTLGCGQADLARVPSVSPQRQNQLHAVHLPAQTRGEAVIDTLGCGQADLARVPSVSPQRQNQLHAVHLPAQTRGEAVIDTLGCGQADLARVPSVSPQRQNQLHAVHLPAQTRGEAVIGTLGCGQADLARVPSVSPQTRGTSPDPNPTHVHAMRLPAQSEPALGTENLQPTSWPRKPPASCGTNALPALQPLALNCSLGTLLARFAKEPAPAYQAPRPPALPRLDAAKGQNPAKSSGRVPSPGQPVPPFGPSRGHGRGKAGARGTSPSAAAAADVGQSVDAWFFRPSDAGSGGEVAPLERRAKPKLLPRPPQTGPAVSLAGAQVPRRLRRPLQAKPAVRGPPRRTLARSARGTSPSAAAAADVGQSVDAWFFRPSDAGSGGEVAPLERRAKPKLLPRPPQTGPAVSLAGAQVPRRLRRPLQAKPAVRGPPRRTLARSPMQRAVVGVATGAASFSSFTLGKPHAMAAGIDVQNVDVVFLGTGSSVAVPQLRYLLSAERRDVCAGSRNIGHI